MVNEFIAKSFCRNCDATLDDGEDRIVVMAVEYRGDEGREPGRGDTCTTNFCMKCVADMQDLKLWNPWKVQSDMKAGPSAERPGDDMMDHAISLQGIAARRRLRSGRSDQSDDEALGKLLSDQRKYRDTLPPDRTDIRRRMQNFIYSPRYRKIPKKQKLIAKLWACGFDQTEIAEDLNSTQQTVSRQLEKILAMVNRP